MNIFTVVETPSFQRPAAKVWSIDQRHDFIDWIASHPAAGDVIPGADGARKVRWSMQGTGKRGGARVIYFSLVEAEIVLLLAVYSKSDKDNMSSAEILRS